MSLEILSYLITYMYIYTKWEELDVCSVLTPLFAFFLRRLGPRRASGIRHVTGRTLLYLRLCHAQLRVPGGAGWPAGLAL
jgi:hypothetical protein